MMMSEDRVQSQGRPDPLSSLSPKTAERFAQMRATLRGEAYEETLYVAEETSADPAESVGAESGQEGATSAKDQPAAPADEQPVFTESPVNSGQSAAAGESPRGGDEQPAAPMRVGLLVWGVVLILIGLLLIATSVSVMGSLQVILVGAFAIAGIAFFVLAATSGKSNS